MGLPFLCRVVVPVFSMLFLLTVQGFAQSDTVLFLRGNIVDSNNNPVSFATIICIARPTATQSYAIADKSGHFTLKFSPEAESLQIEISAIGYATKNEVLPVGGIRAALTIILQKSAELLPTATIKFNPPVRVSGDSVIYSASSFRKITDNTLEDLLKRLPGVSVLPDGKLAFNGQQISRVLLEGDDLFGEGYQSLSKNLSSNDVDFIDIIRNYNNPNDITQSLKKDNELVMNLRFIKKTLRLFSNAEAGINTGFDRYSINANSIGLLKKTKFVIINNENNIGKLSADSHAATEDPAGESSMRNFYKKPVKISGQGNLTANSFYQKKALFNYTSFTSVNWLLKAKNLDISVRGVVDNDRIRQMRTNQQTYQVPVSTLQINEVQNSLDVERIRSGIVHIRYTPGRKFQMAYGLELGISKAFGETNGQLQNVRYQRFNGLSNANSFQFIDAKWRKTATQAWVFQAFVQQYTAPQRMQVSPMLYDSFLSPNYRTYRSAFQEFDIKVVQRGANLKWLWRNGTNSMQVSSGVTYTGSKFGSNIRLYGDVDSVDANPASFTNKSNTSTSIFCVSTRFSKIIDPVTISLVADGQLYTTGMTRIPDKLRQSFLFLNPGTSIRIDFQNQKFLDFSYNLGNRMPSFDQLQAAYYMNTYRNFFLGAGSIKNETVHQFSLNYSAAGFTKNRQFFFAGLQYNMRQSPYLESLIIGPYYNKTDLLMHPTSVNTVLAFARVEKFFLKIHSTIVFGLTAARMPNFSLVNAQFIRATGYTFSPAIEHRTSFSNGLSSEVSVRYTHAGQKSSDGQKTNLKTSQLDGSAKVVFKLSEKLSAIPSFQAYVLWPAGQPATSLGVLDAEIKYQCIPQKLKLVLSGSNLTNVQKFTSNSINAVSSSQSEIALMQRYLMLKVQFQF